MSTDNSPAKTPATTAIQRLAHEPQNSTTSNGASQDLSRLDYSCEVITHLDSAFAVADLIATVCGNTLDGSDSRIEDLSRTTIRAAMYDIQHNIETAQELQVKMDERDRQISVRAEIGLRRAAEVAHG
jgi:hypothetical protein